MFSYAKSLLLPLPLCLALALQAQSPARMSRLTTSLVPADSSAEYFAIQRESAEVYRMNKTTFPRLCWTSLTGPQTFYTLVPMNSMAEMNDPTWLSKQGDEEARNARRNRLAKSTGGGDRKILTSQPDLSWTATRAGAPNAFGVLAIDRVEPGKVEEYSALLKEAGAVYKQMGKAKDFRVSRVTFGGNVFEFMVLTEYASLADITSVSDFSKAMGEAKYAVYLKKMGEAIDSRERHIVRYRPEFSYVPAN